MELLGGNKNVLYHDCSSGNVTVSICQNPSNCSLTVGDFIVCELHLNKAEKRILTLSFTPCTNWDNTIS